MDFGINLAETPDIVPTLDPGQYLFNVDKYDNLPAEGNRLARHSFAFSVAEGIKVGKKIFDDFPLDFLKKDPQGSMAVRLRNLVKACGVVPDATTGGDSLVGKQFKAAVSRETYTQNGLQKEKAVITQYLP